MPVNTSPGFFRTPAGLLMVFTGLLGAVASGVTILEYFNKKAERAEKQMEPESPPEQSKTTEVAEKSDEKAEVTIDRKDALSTARAVLTAYQQKDFPTLQGLSTDRTKEQLSDLVSDPQHHNSHGKYVDDFRWEAVSKWDRSLDEVRYRHYVGGDINTYEAHVRFVEMGLPEIAIVTLTWQNDQWSFEDINTVELDSFLQGRTKFRLEAAAY